jgi:hypothetical protein
MQQTFAKKNEVAVTDTVRKDLGLAPSERLNASAIETALDKQSAPYESVRKISSLTPDADVVQSIESLRGPALIGGEASTAAVSRLIDDAVSKINQGRSGALVVDDIRQLRREAQNVYKSRDKGNNPPPSDVAAADARMGIANALEDLIDANVRDPKMIAELQAARTKMAQIYQHSRALDYAKEKVDPQAYVKMFEESQGKITGVASDIAKAASIFPEYFTLTPAEVKGMPRLSRAGIGAAIGAAIGALGGPITATAGLMAGTVAGSLGSGLAAKRMATPAYQAAYAMPKDYRPSVNMLRPVEPNATPNALAPYRPEVVGPSGGRAAPALKIVSYDQEGNPIYQPNVEDLTAARGQGFTRPSEPIFGNQPTVFESQRGLPNEVPRQIYEAQKRAEMAQEFRAKDERQPARGGTPLVFDERGRLVPADQTLRGATPNIQIIESTGKNLSGAADILASGRSPALMSAEQKIAWNKTKVDLAEIMPGMKALNDKAIAAKMMDRAWIQEAIVKAKEKAAAYDAMSKRDISAQRIREAAIERERLQDIAEALQEQLGSRPVSSGSQGPKTQAAQRNKNALAPANENRIQLNNMMPGRP